MRDTEQLRKEAGQLLADAEKANKAPPADSKEWEGKPDKLQYFSPNPGVVD